MSPSPANRRSPLPNSHHRVLADKIVVITGAGRGIGRATAELFACEGAKLVLCARTARELNEVASSIKAGGGETITRVTDISSPREVRTLVALAARRYGRLDVLINNAGILGPRVPVAEYPLHEWTRVLQINLSGTFYMTREVARIMMRQRAGSIITVSSSVGRAGRARWGAYAASKFGTEGLMQVLADELRPYGVVAVTFNPGGTRTAMRAEAYPDEDPIRLQPPSVPAEALLRLATSLSPELSGRAFDPHHLP